MHCKEEIKQINKQKVSIMKKFLKSKLGKCFLYTLLVVVLFSCNKLEEGNVVNKFYEAPRHYTIVEYNVALKMSMVKNMYDDADYGLIVSDVIKGDTITERHEVSSKTYDLYSIGDRIKLK